MKKKSVLTLLKLLTRLKHAVLVMRFFFSANKKWVLPQRSQMIVYDSLGIEPLWPYIKEYNPEIINFIGRTAEILIPILLKSLFRKGSVREAYIDCYIEEVKPKLIITHIDNSIDFILLSRRHPKIKTMSIQNGWRGYYMDVFEYLSNEKQIKKHCQVDYIFVFGNSVAHELKKLIRGELIPMGGLKNNIFPKVYEKEEGSILFISQFRGLNDIFKFDGETITGEQFFELSDQVIISHLASYAKRKKKSFHIATYNKAVEQDRSLQEEIAYYDRLAGESLDYKIRKDLASSYEAVDKAEVVVTIDSTIGYESAVRGNKTAFFSIRGSQLQKKGYDFGWPAQINKNGSFWTNEANKMNFENILNYLFDLTQKGWEEELIKNNFEEYICYDPGNSKLKTKIDKIMSDK